MKIILASQSPRRKSFLTQMGLEFDVVHSDFEEYVNEKLTMHELVEELGLGKVMEVAKKHPEAIVIGGDSMVTIDGKQLGKPNDEADAREILKNYRNRAHQVMTSVAVVCLSKNYKKVGSDTTTIEFDELDDDFIDKYIATDNWSDKAGGYAIQHPLVNGHVKNIGGRIDTVMGMSTKLVAEYLKELGINTEPVELTRDQLRDI